MGPVPHSRAQLDFELSTTTKISSPDSRTSLPHLPPAIEHPHSHETPETTAKMAPKEPFKVHSLNKHIENTQKGMSAEAQYNRRPTNRGAAIIKKESSSLNPNNLFSNNNDDDDEEEASDSDSSSDEGASEFLRKLSANNGAKSASAAPRRRSKNEEIADSDDERKASAKTIANVSKKEGAPVKAAANASSDSSTSSSDSESDEGDAKVKTNGADASSSSSSSGSSDSASESESEDEGAKKAKAKKVATADESSSGSDTSESESESEPETPSKNKSKAKAIVSQITTATTSATSATSSSGESEGESEDEQVARPVAKVSKKQAASASSSESEDSDEEMADESMHIVDRQEKRQHAVPNFIAPDFVLRKGDDGASGHDVAEICNQANLDGKQFWYFTVPSNVPISVIQNLEIPMDQSQQSDRLFSHEGEDYGVSFESIAPKGNIQILIPSSDGSQYRSSKLSSISSSWLRN